MRCEGWPEGLAAAPVLPLEPVVLSSVLSCAVRLTSGRLAASSAARGVGGWGVGGGDAGIDWGCRVEVEEAGPKRPQVCARLHRAQATHSLPTAPARDLEGIPLRVQTSHEVLINLVLFAPQSTPKPTWRCRSRSLYPSRTQRHLHLMQDAHVYRPALYRPRSPPVARTPCTQRPSSPPPAPAARPAAAGPALTARRTQRPARRSQQHPPPRLHTAHSTQPHTGRQHAGRQHVVHSTQHGDDRSVHHPACAHSTQRAVQAHRAARRATARRTQQHPPPRLHTQHRWHSAQHIARQHVVHSSQHVDHSGVHHPACPHSTKRSTQGGVLSGGASGAPKQAHNVLCATAPPLGARVGALSVITMQWPDVRHCGRCQQTYTRRCPWQLHCIDQLSPAATTAGHRRSSGPRRRRANCPPSDEAPSEQ